MRLGGGNVDDDDISTQPGCHLDAVLQQLNTCQSLVFELGNPIFLSPMTGVQVQQAESVFLEPSPNRLNFMVRVKEIRIPMVAPVDMREACFSNSLQVG